MEALETLTKEQRTKLEDAQDKITIQMMNNLDFGNETSLNEMFSLYHYSEDDIFVVVLDDNNVWEEILQVMTDGEEIIFEAL